MRALPGCFYFCLNFWRDQLSILIVAKDLARTLPYIFHLVIPVTRETSSDKLFQHAEDNPDSKVDITEMLRDI